MVALDRQRRNRIARHLGLNRAGYRGQHLARGEVEDQLIVGDREVLIVRRIKPGRRQYRCPQRVLALQLALDMHGLDYKVNEGDVAVYLPKIELHVTDSLGRSCQLTPSQASWKNDCKRDKQRGDDIAEDGNSG